MELVELEKLEKKLHKDNSFIELKPQLKQMSSAIFRYAKHILKSNKQLSSYHNKLVLNLQFLVHLSNQPLYKNFSNDGNYITKWLKKYKYLSSKSMVYPINSKFLTSTLSKSFLKVDLPMLDLILDYRDNIFQIYQSCIDIAIYVYLRIYHLKKIDKQDIIKLDVNNIFNIGNKVHLYISTAYKTTKGYLLMHKYFLDDFIYDKIALNFENIVFKHDICYYERELEKYLKERKLFYQDIKNCLHFEYAYLNNQLDLSLATAASYPKLNLLEIDYIFPGIFPKKLLDIERHNFDVYFNNFLTNDENFDIDDEDLDSNSKACQYVTQNIEAYEELSKCRSVPLDVKKLQTYFDRFYKLINEFKYSLKSNDDYMYKIFDFVEYLLKKADKNYTNKPIKNSTLKEYIRIVFKYCFHHIIINGGIDSKVVSVMFSSLNDSIDKKSLNLYFTPKTSKTYFRIVKLFLRKQTAFNTNKKISMIVDVRRSIVFCDEIDMLVNQLINDSTIKFKDTEKIVRHKTYKHNQYAIFCLLLYYSGLRKSELRTLLTKNIFQIHENQYEIIVSKENFRLTAKANSENSLSPKSDSAIRRVRFVVNNYNHNRILKKHIKFLQTNKYKFVFPAISKEGKVLKTSTILNSDLDYLSKKLAAITGRYTPLHSLRHSYATFKFFTKYKKDDISSYFMYLVSSMMGHSEPSVTIYNYIHIDLLKIFSLKESKYHIPDFYVEYSKDLKI